MNFVEPIRDIDKMNDILAYTKRINHRNYIMFMIGFYTALRISDILRLKVGHVRNRKSIGIREIKTGKQKIIAINPILKSALDEYIKDKPNDEYLIKSREKENKPLSREMAYKIVKRTCEKFGVENTGTHSLRKTFGFHYYNRTKDIVTLQHMFNHSHPSTTLDYIGITTESVNKSVKAWRYD